MKRKVSSMQKTVCRKQKINCLLSTAYCLLFVACCSLLTIVTGCSDDPVRPLYEKAEENFSNMAYLKAIDNYNEIVNGYPESSYAPASQYKIGLINSLYLKDYRKAMNAYTTLILLYPKSKEIVLAKQDMAEIFIKRGDYRKAIGEYQWLVKNTIGTERDDFQYQIAMTYLKLTDIKQARIELQEVVKSSPNSQIAPQVYYQIANTYYLEGDYSGAINAYERLISLYPSDPYATEARLWKAICIEETGNLDEAMELYTELEKSYPNPDAIRVRMDAIEERENKNIPVARKEN